MGIYLLKFTACLALLYFFYKVCLENENMHTFKRVYLLISLAAALIIPALVFTEYVEAPPTSLLPVQEYTTPQATAGPIGIPLALEKDVLDIEPILWAIYFIGLAFFGIKFLKNLLQIFKRINDNPKQRWQQFFHVLLKEPVPPHTFLSYIFLNKSKFEANQIPEEVLLHEQTHASQKHSYDILLVEFLQVIFWMNPFIYLLKKAIKLNHEFLADQAVLNKNISKANYQNTLLSYLSEDTKDHHQSPLVNPINYSSIKKRFKIMKTHTSKKAVLLRSILVLPLFSLLLLGFSETKLVQKQIKSDTNNPLQINEILPPIKIHINENQEITIEEEVIAVEDLSNKLSQIIKSDSSKPNSVREVHIEAKGNLNLKLLKSIKEQITKEGCILKTVTADIIKGMNKTLENYRGIAFIARDTFHIKQDDGTFVLGFTTKENPVISKTQSSANTKQDSATIKELAEYNKLAKHYNSMSRNKMKIYKKDVERLENLFSKMSDNQKTDNEPFPDFPKPPPVPKAPGDLNEREEAAHTIQKIIDEQDSYDVVNTGIRINPNGKKIVFPETNSNLHTYYTGKNQRNSIGLNEYLNSPELKNAQYYFEGNKVSPKEGMNIIKTKKDIKIETIPHITKQPEVRIYKSGSKDSIPPPPNPTHAPRVLKGTVSDIPPPPRPVALKGAVSAIPAPPRPASPNTANDKNKGWTVSTSANRNARLDNTSEAEYGELPIPPPAPAIAVHADKKAYSKELNTSIYKYLENNNKLEQAVALLKKNNKGSKQELWNLYNETMELYVSYHNLAKKEGNFIQPIPAYKEREIEKTIPLPPEPMTPLDHVIAMAKKDATFFYEGKAISSDKAIDLMKTNKDLNIDSRTAKGKRPVVKISTAPIEH